MQSVFHIQLFWPAAVLGHAEAAATWHFLSCTDLNSLQAAQPALAAVFVLLSVAECTASSKQEVTKTFTNSAAKK